MGGKYEKLRDALKDVLEVEASNEDTETKIRDLVITKLTDLSAPDCSHIIKYLSFQDLVNLRGSCITLFNVVMADHKSFLNKVCLAIDLKDDDYDVIRKFPLNHRVFFPLEIRLRGEIFKNDDFEFGNREFYERFQR